MLGLDQCGKDGLLLLKKKFIYLFRCNKIEKPFFPIQGDVIKSFLLFCADVEGLDFAFNSK